MSSIDMLTTAYRTARTHGWDVAAEQARHKLAKRAGVWQPSNDTGTYNQKRLLHNAFDKHEQVWVIWFDGGGTVSLADRHGQSPPLWPAVSGGVDRRRRHALHGSQE
jgi:hypothetical protein